LLLTDAVTGAAGVVRWIGRQWRRVLRRLGADAPEPEHDRSD
jgi:hypothetical protein